MLRKTSILTLGLMSFVAVAVAADLSGRWEGKVIAPGSGDEIAIAFIFKAEGEKVTGSVETPIGSLQISNGKIIGDDLTFSVDFSGISIPHKGKIAGDAIFIKTEGQMAMEFTLKRAPAK